MWMKQNLAQMQGTYGTTTWMKRRQNTVDAAAHHLDEKQLKRM
jgi:hypothetical protein